MDHLERHSQQLDQAFMSVVLSGQERTEHEGLIQALCSSELDKAIRDSFSISSLRAKGVFFTGDQLAMEAASLISRDLSLNSKILDPACGSGNLLIASSKYLPVFKSLRETLLNWGKVLYGYDTNFKFLRLAKKRIVLEAINRGSHTDIKSIQEAEALLANIRKKDALSKGAGINEGFSHIIMNPPFSTINNEYSSLWRKGVAVNAAAVFFSKYINLKGSQKTKLVAILPEVLRSGNRYNRWREEVSTQFKGRVDIKGRFDRNTDIDVFMLHGCGGIKSNDKVTWSTPLKSTSGGRLSDSFEVSVGSLVAYRDKKEGIRAPFIYPKNVEPWKKSPPTTEYRRFSGRLVKPPFVVIRRTSSPKDKYRAVASVITGKEKVAIENHFIVCVPKTKRVADCMKLLEACKTERTNTYFNETIRCRHLTVSSVKNMPMTRL